MPREAYRRTEDFRSRNKLLIACEEMDFTWSDSEVKEFVSMWKAGISIEQMAAKFERDPDEVLVLAIDRCRADSIGKRSGGARGVVSEGVAV
ncbi:hypothetical protein J2Z69_000750 [Paenibacillus shirakamiensis]|uniref:Helix-turn-helix domain containing protein n=1 Tax=Paenibacillus shirakamiensis TaxID=1265935 RepID=A0ABS4JDE2_9BACL|nr:hypothetical protein [Paenibacillus shirakamiensis]MBP1999731.1 hypothetical protein [Paenibacillus shirakamiensis]